MCAEMSVANWWRGVCGMGEYGWGVWGMIWQERDLYVGSLHVVRKSQEHKKKKSIDAADQSKDLELGEWST